MFHEFCYLPRLTLGSTSAVRVHLSPIRVPDLKVDCSARTNGKTDSKWVIFGLSLSKTNLIIEETD